MEKRAVHAEKQRDEALDKVKEQRTRLYENETELKKEKGKNLKLRAQLNRDYENSSMPSSKSIKHKKIHNSREKTGKKPGSQAIRGMAGKGRCRMRHLSFFRYCGRRWMTRISRKHIPFGVVNDVNYGGPGICK